MAGAQGTSTQAVLTALLANTLLFGCFIGGFLVLRLKFKRIYSPKSSFDLVPEEKKPEPLPLDPFRWVLILLTKPHSFIIQQCGLDGYFFLRYIFVMGLLFAAGILTWTILLPVNAVHGRNGDGLDQLSISNVLHRRRYYAHAFVSWVFYGGVIYIIYRELFFFNSFRCAVLLSPKYATKLASRTVLFQSVPDTWLDEKQFHKLFNGVKRVYVSRNVRILNHKNNVREALALKLEKLTTQLLQKAVKAKIKADKKGVHVEDPTKLESYVPREKWPRHHENGIFKPKVDSIEHTREKLRAMDREVYRLQKQFRKSPPKNSIFVEFVDQYTAQLAFQATVHHNPLRMSPKYVGLEPADVDWDNMRLFWWERITRRGIAVSAITALVIFWAIPVAFVGVISNITYLTNKLTFLRFILKCPKWLLGTITSLLPTIMLALLMAILPMIIRGLGKVAGCVSAQSVEHFTHNAYFAFLMVNGFLVTALSSLATSAVTRIVQNPTLALSILARGLPTSSNFYISYLILQGLTVAGGSLFQAVGLFLYYILGTLFDSTLRKKWARFSGLGTVAWGTTFPPVVTLATITLTFSIIAPMILLFAAASFGLLYIAWAHNLSYIFVEGPDARGSHYPKALFQTFTGLYIGEVCLLGLFVIGKGWGPVALEAVMLGATIFAHINLKSAFDHLLEVVPIDTLKPLDGISHTWSYVQDSDYQKVLERKTALDTEKALAQDLKEAQHVQKAVAEENGHLENGQAFTPLMADRDFKTTESSNMLVRFIRPDVFLNFRHAKSLIPSTYNEADTSAENKHAYDQPVISASMPVLWIPKDPYGWSEQQIAANSDLVEMHDSNSGFSEKGKICFLGPPPY